MTKKMSEHVPRPSSKSPSRHSDARKTKHRKPSDRWDADFTVDEYQSVPVKRFTGSKLHDEHADRFTVARLSESFIGTVSKKTKDRIAQALLASVGAKSVADLVTEGVRIDVAETLKAGGVRDLSTYEALHGESRFFHELTEMDLLSSEGMTRDEIAKIVERLLVDHNDHRLSDRHALETINKTYRHALEFLEFLGITPNETQLSRKFSSVDQFVNHVDSLKPGNRKNGYGMVIECAVVRAMDDVHDVLSNDRYKKLDQEAALVLEKIRSLPGVTLKEAGEGRFHISYVPPKHPEKFFQGTLYMRQKNFFKILLKMAFNRKYTTIDSLKDLLGLRFETENPDKAHLANAVEFFAKHVFEKCEYDQKGHLCDIGDLRARGVPTAEVSHLKASTDEDIENGDLTGRVSMRGGKGGGSRSTGTMEMQFQYVGGMEGGFLSSEFYDFKKLLTAASRKLKGFDIKNLKFFIRLFLAPATGISDQAILSRLFFPPKRSRSERKMSHGDDAQAKKSPKDRFIEDHWAESHGFLLPLATTNGGVRFTTLDAFSPEYYAIYGRHYPTPARIDFDYLLKMYERAEVDDKVKEYRHKDWGV